MTTQMNAASPQNGEAMTAQLNQMPLSFCELDDFEEGLLPILRHFMMNLTKPEAQAWQHAFKIAAERWGETLGLSVAHALFKLVNYTFKARRHPFECIDPLSIDQRNFVTRDEQSFLQMLHHMRRDETPQARDAVANVTGCTMDPDVIRAGLSFADRFPAGRITRNSLGQKPNLRVVD